MYKQETLYVNGHYDPCKRRKYPIKKHSMTHIKEEYTL